MSADPLLPHLDAAYRLAQAITLDPEAATSLTEDAFRAAYRENPEDWPADEVRDRIMRHIISTHLSRTESVDVQDPAPEAFPHSEPGDAFRGRIARENVDRLLPTALAALPDRERTVLLLVESENLSVPDAARILNTSPEAIRSQHKGAMEGLEQALFRSANVVEREVLSASLPRGWLREALTRHARARFAPTPPTIDVAPVRPIPREESRRTHAEAADALSVHRDRRPRHIILGLIFILAAGLFGYLASSLLEENDTTSIVQLSADRSIDAEIDLATRIPTEAETYLLEQTGRRLRVPRIEDAALAGVGVAEVASGVRVPILVFRDRENGETITIYGYSYALLDQYARQVTLERDVMQQIESEDHFDLHDLGENQVLIWRQRDEIYVAVTRGDAEVLKDRIQNGA